MVVYYSQIIHSFKLLFTYKEVTNRRHFLPTKKWGRTGYSIGPRLQPTTTSNSIPTCISYSDRLRKNMAGQHFIRKSLIKPNPLFEALKTLWWLRLDTTPYWMYTYNDNLKLWPYTPKKKLMIIESIHRGPILRNCSGWAISQSCYIIAYQQPKHAKHENKRCHGQNANVWNATDLCVWRFGVRANIFCTGV